MICLSILAFVINLYVFFIMYIASMGMIRAHKEQKLNNILWALCIPFVILALIIDFINNIIIFTILFLELPKELLVTDRLKRHVNKDTLRGKISRWFGEFLLNPFDPTGNHLD